MKVNVIDVNGNTKDAVELNDDVFKVKINKYVISDSIRHELANKRQGTAKVKDRGEVNFSTIKPWRQKGLARARAGSRKSPVWVGGGTMFGPIPRDYSYNLPKKVKRLSIKSILTDKMRKNKLRIIENIDVQSGKTKEAASVLLKLLSIKSKLDKLKKNQATKEISKYRVTVIVTDEDKNLKRAIKNLRWAKTLNYNRLSSHNLFYSHEVLCLKKAAEKLNDFYGKRV